MLIDLHELAAATAKYITRDLSKPKTPAAAKKAAKTHMEKHKVRYTVSNDILKIAEKLGSRPWYPADDPTLPDETLVYAWCKDLGNVFPGPKASDIRAGQKIFRESHGYEYFIMERTEQTPPTPPE